MRDVGKNIKDARTRARLTQDDLAERVHVSRQTVSNYETGFSRPDVEMLVRLAEALGADANTLLYGEVLNETTEQTRRERRRNLVRLVIAGVCTAMLAAGYSYLAPIVDRLATRHYEVMPRYALWFLWLPLLLMVASWTALQLLGTFFGLKPFPEQWGKWVRRALLAGLALFLLFQLPYWTEGYLRLRDGLAARTAGQSWSSMDYWAGVPEIRKRLSDFGVSVLTAVWLHRSNLPSYAAFVLTGALLWLSGFPKVKQKTEDQKAEA